MKPDGAVKELDKGEYRCYIYKLKRNSLSDIIPWLCTLANESIPDIAMLNLRDTVNSYSEGNLSVQLRVTITEDVLAKEIESRKTDKIVIDCSIEQTPLSVSIDLKRYMATIAIDQGHYMDSERLKNILDL